MKIKLIKTEKVLASTQISLADYVINPYRGCSFQCLYCYAQKNKNIQKSKEAYLGVKINAPVLLEKELCLKKPKKVLLGSTAECFQEIEKKYQISSQIINILNKHKIPFLILTKSSLIDSCLSAISKNKNNEIYYTLNLSSQKKISNLEKNSSCLASRLETIKKITEKKIKLRIHIGPFIPYVSNLEKILQLLPERITKINVELYNAKMGNLELILNKISPSKAKLLAGVYSSQKAYLSYTLKLKKNISKTSKKTKINFFYLEPGFDSYYTREINYNQNPE